MATRSVPVRRPTVRSRSIPHWSLVVLRRPDRPPVIRYKARCAAQKVRMNQRGWRRTARGAFVAVAMSTSPSGQLFWRGYRWTTAHEGQCRNPRKKYRGFSPCAEEPIRQRSNSWAAFLKSLPTGRGLRRKSGRLEPLNDQPDRQHHLLQGEAGNV